MKFILFKIKQNLIDEYGNFSDEDILYSQKNLEEFFKNEKIKGSRTKYVYAED
jgi:hypothetical protein